jgi:PIN domain nuclease of toxin-antitoxin system
VTPLKTATKLLLDTHALIWWLLDDPNLSRTVRTVLAGPRPSVFVSAITVTEIAIKLSINKLPIAGELDQDLLQLVVGQGFHWLPVTAEHAYAIRHLPWHHRDPFDRVLIAQCQVEGLTLVSEDRAMRRYPVTILW